MNVPSYPIARLLALVLFIIGAVIAIFVDTADPEVIYGLLFSGLAALSLS